jgi:hypothetical protein
VSVDDRYVKTQAGIEEIQTRKLGLPHRLRCALILVDGVHPVAVLQKEARKVSAPDDFIDQLLALNLIERKGVAETAAADSPPGGATDEFAQFRGAKDFMTATIVDALGIKSFFFSLKLERTATRADLKALLPDYSKAMSKALGPDVSEVMVTRLEKMLA